MNWLINTSLEKDMMRLYFKTENGRWEISDSYFPYFYVVSKEPEETRHLISGHPLVIDAKLEDKFISILGREKKSIVKVLTSTEHFKTVIGDIRKMGNITEVAETTIPHHFRYICDKGISYFTPYELEGDNFNFKFRNISSEQLPDLTVEIMEKDKPIPMSDVVITCGGDKFLQGRKGVVSSPLGCFIKGAIHIDIEKDIQYDIYNDRNPTNLLEFGKERLIRIIELSRLTGARPDMVSRITPGKLNTYLHFEAARKNGYIVPDLKKEVERPKNLRLLKVLDNGGTIFYPKPAVYYNVAKCDFASMYPNIIVKFNISPETMACDCSDFIEVPEAGWHICKNKGIIPQGLEKVLKRRLLLKKLMKASTGKERKIFDIQQRALKNILVCSFGYLGFSNFVFSNVECKECVMLFGRKILQRTKEIAEEFGLEVIYGIVDSVFVKNGTPETYNAFVKKASEEFGIELELDSIFRGIAFPSSGDNSGAANKYYGVTNDGKIEARGIAYRHSDSPEFIKQFQAEAIPELFGGKKLNEIYVRYQDAILNKHIPIEKMVILKSVNRTHYKVNAPHAVAYKKAPNGLGYVNYVYTVYGPTPLEMANADELDNKKYLYILRKSLEELFLGLPASDLISRG